MESNTKAYADFLDGIFLTAEATSPTFEQLAEAHTRLAHIAGHDSWDISLVEQVGLLHVHLTTRRPIWREEWKIPLAEIFRHLSDPEDRERLAIAHARIKGLAQQIQLAS